MNEETSWVGMVKKVIQNPRDSLKEQSNKIFNCQFFSSLKPAWATDQWV